MTAPAAGCWFTLQSPSPDGTAAIACIELGAASVPELEAALDRIGCGTLAPGDARPCDIAGIDRAFVVRWSGCQATIMPHAGPVVVAALLDHLQRQGLAERPLARGIDGLEESGATDDLSGSALCERHLPAALAAAASPLAVDLLLDQPRRWAEYDRTGARWQDDAEVQVRSRQLRCLLVEPIVAVVGRPNIGKSTLLNSMAGRCVAIVRDEAGTTRDHVGVSLVLGDGLAVRWLDTPGLAEPLGGATGDRVGDRAGELAGVGFALARRAVASASVLLLCGDVDVPPPELGEVLAMGEEAADGGSVGPELVRVALRTDRGKPGWPHRVAVGGLHGAGSEVGDRSRAELASVVSAVCEAVLPGRVREDAGPWAFWLRL